jgi:hypothetical protein
MTVDRVKRLGSADSAASRPLRNASAAFAVVPLRSGREFGRHRPEL